MDLLGLALTAIGTLAGIAGAFFAWVPIRRQLLRKRAPAVVAPRGDGDRTTTRHDTGNDTDNDMVTGYDAFISYCHADRNWVAQFVDRLRQEGLKIAWDGEFVLGDVLVIEIQERIRNSANGVLIFSPASVASRWVQEEYADMMTRAINAKRRFIPVVIEDVELPGFAASRFYADMRDSNPNKDGTFQQIVQALRTPL